MQTYRLIGVAYPSAPAPRKHSGSLRKASGPFQNASGAFPNASGSFRNVSGSFQYTFWRVRIHIRTRQNLFGSLRNVFGSIRKDFRASGKTSGPSGKTLGASGCVSGSSKCVSEAPGCVLESPGGVLAGSGRVPERVPKTFQAPGAPRGGIVVTLGEPGGRSCYPPAHGEPDRLPAQGPPRPGPLPEAAGADRQAGADRGSAPRD